MSISTTQPPSHRSKGFFANGLSCTHLSCCSFYPSLWITGQGIRVIFYLHHIVQRQKGKSSISVTVGFLWHQWNEDPEAVFRKRREEKAPKAYTSLSAWGCKYVRAEATDMTVTPERDVVTVSHPSPWRHRLVQSCKGRAAQNLSICTLPHCGTPLFSVWTVTLTSLTCTQPTMDVQRAVLASVKNEKEVPGNLMWIHEM